VKQAVWILHFPGMREKISKIAMIQGLGPDFNLIAPERESNK
jgi:hypothetical protein